MGFNVPQARTALLSFVLLPQEVHSPLRNGEAVIPAASGIVRKGL